MYIFLMPFDYLVVTSTFYSVSIYCHKNYGCIIVNKLLTAALAQVYLKECNFLYSFTFFTSSIKEKCNSFVTELSYVVLDIISCVNVSLKIEV